MKLVIAAHPYLLIDIPKLKMINSIEVYLSCLIRYKTLKCSNLLLRSCILRFCAQVSYKIFVMANRTLSKSKQVAIGHLVLNGNFNIRRSARELKISRTTLKRYVGKYTPFIATNYDQIINGDFIVPVFANTASLSEKNEEALSLISKLVHSEGSICTTKKEFWLRYLELSPDGYRYSRFSDIFSMWLKENKFLIPSKWKLLSIPPDDSKILKQWRRSSDRRKWEKSVAITEAISGKTLSAISRKIERPVDKVQDWLTSYRKNGIKGLEKKPRRANPEVLSKMKMKLTNLIKLIHESPKLHGINRTSWFLVDLSQTYKKVYGENMSKSSISSYLKKEGYVYRKAREVLTSPDPAFREKLASITNILAHLKENECFFSIDEFGPFAVEIKGGRSLVKRGERRTFPQLQKSKGFTICTAALELSTNQITHFYSQKKDTEEMIKLIDLLLIKYNQQHKVYLSWDAASWHASKRLIDFVALINSKRYKSKYHVPIIELAPLPASAQFLNVIESVFSGLAKSIIHNSDYGSLDECKNAIDLYFKARNEHFLKYPKRAGNKIWGNELVVPMFKVDHNCKDPRYR